MDDAALDDVLAQWSRLGIFLAIAPSQEEPDVEQLLVTSARLIPDFGRMLSLATTWLIRCERLVARNRLRAMAKAVTDTEHSACLGLLLSFAREQTGSNHLSAAIHECRPMRPAAAMLREERGFAHRAVVELEAHRISRRWGILTPEPDDKQDALRPVSWILANNPSLRLRAMLNGGLRASVLAELRSNVSAGRSESSLARAIGVTRPALRTALDQLEFCGLISRSREGNSARIRPNDAKLTI